LGIHWFFERVARAPPEEAAGSGNGRPGILQNHWENKHFAAYCKWRAPRAAGGPPEVPSRIPWSPNKNAAENKGILQDSRWLPGLAAVLAWGGPEPATAAPETFKNNGKSNISCILQMVVTILAGRSPRLGRSGIGNACCRNL